MRTTISIALAILITSCTGSKDLFEGKITYGLEYDDVPEEYEAFIDMFPKESVTYIGEGFTRVEQDMGMGMKQTLIIMDGTTTMLLDMMGQKIKVIMDDEDVPEDTEEPSIEVTAETDSISGYLCKKALIGTGDEPIEVWFTEDIPNGNSQFKELSGMPMKYTIDQQGMTVTMTTTEVKTMSLGKEYFEVPEDYTEMSMEELQSMGGGF